MKILLLFLIFVTLKTQAQPGGGGGLIIDKIYDENLSEIILKHNNLEIELLLLDSVMTVLSKKIININEKLYLPPLNGYGHSNTTYGILIKYQKKEYRIDFENILSENGGGVREKIDSLVLFKPYILNKRNYHHPFHDGNEFQNYFLLRNTSEMYLGHGITPHTYNKLSKIDLIFEHKEYSFNRKPKPWMANFKNLYQKYRKHNYIHEKIEIITFLKELEQIIIKYGKNDAFILFKMNLLYKINSHKEIINLYEKHIFEYNNQNYIDNILKHSYTKCKKYNKAVKICEMSAVKILKSQKENYYKYIYHKLYIEIYYQNIDRKKEIQDILNSEENEQYYDSTFTQFEILHTYCIYKFVNKIKGLEQMNIFEKLCIPNPILKEIYPSVSVKQSSDNFCGSLVFGIVSDIL